MKAGSGRWYWFLVSIAVLVGKAQGGLALECRERTFLEIIVSDGVEYKMRDRAGKGLFTHMVVDVPEHFLRCDDEIDHFPRSLSQAR